MGDVVGVVLAAGASTRLGRPKQTLRLGGTTLLEYVVGGAERSRIDRLVVVTNDAVAATAGARLVDRVELVVNPDPLGGGSASSMRIGLGAAGECDAAMILLGDMPEVDAGVIDRVVESWRAQPTWAAISRYADGGTAHPFLFSAESFDVLTTLCGDKPIWRLLHGDDATGGALPGTVAEVLHDRPTPLDVDTWDDYLAVCTRLAMNPEPSRAP